MKVEFKLSGVDGIIKTLRSLPPEIVSKRGGPVKLALAKGARVIRDEAKKNLLASIARNGSESTGLLEKNLIVSRGKAPNDGNGERYLVRVRRKNYEKPEGARGKPVTTLKTAHLLEYGSEHQPATPWLRPAFASTKQIATDTVITDLKSRIDKIVAKLAQQNASK